MIGLFIANPGPTAKSPRRHVARLFRGVRRNGMRTRRNVWPKHKAEHGVAARIGWAYRGDRKRRPAAPMAYMRASGLSLSAMARYRKGRKTSPKRLLRRRFARKHKTSWRAKPRLMSASPYLYNPRRSRRAGSYAQYVKRFAAKSGLSGPALFKAAARARRGGRSNQGLPGAVYFNNRKRSKSRRTRRSRARRNPILPYMAWNNRGRSRRRVGRNGILPYAAFNPGDADPVAALGTAIETTFSMDFWKNTVLPLGAGFIGGQFAGGLVYALAQKIAPAGSIDGVGTMPTIARIGSRAVGAAALSGVAFLATKNRDLAGKVLAGGMVAVLAQVIQEVFGAETYAKMTGMSDIGLFANDLTSDLKKRIAASIRGQMSGQMGSFMTTQNLGPAPRLGDFVTTQGIQQAPIKAGPSVVTDLSSFSDSVADMMMV